ncbi:MAG: glucose-6-phosphate dehydrogenase [Armatimonadia bacterium]
MSPLNGGQRTEAVETTAWTPGAACPRFAEVTALVLFGATGDLTRRKLMPAIYSLMADGLLPCGLPILSVGRRVAAREQLLEEFHEAAATRSRRKPLDEALWAAMAEGIHYVRGELDDSATYAAVKEKLEQLDSQAPAPMNRLFYLAVPPHFFRPVIDNLSASGLSGQSFGRHGWPRIVVEKPFGSDLESARELNRQLQMLFSEKQIYRMDHYLGKETVQNLLVLRFANAIFEPLWNHRYISNVQITISETVGLEGRGQYFDRSGMLRDVVQNHMFELLALTAMEPPVSMDADAVRDEKTKVLRSLRPLTEADVAQRTVRARYDAGEVEGQQVPAYLQEPGVAPESQTETYAALRLEVDNWRWAGVPFLLRAGKRLKSRATEIVVRFRPAPHLVFEGQERSIEPNALVLRIQPNEGVSLCFAAKEPGPGLHIQPVPLEFHFADAFKIEPPDAYERLILDSLLGDGTLFARADSIEQSWSLMMPILEAWQAGASPLATYPAGSWGPPEAKALIEPTGDQWQEPGRCLWAAEPES